MVKQVDMLPVQYVVQQEFMKRVRKWVLVCGFFLMFIIGVSVSIRMKVTAAEIELLPLKNKATLQDQREQAMAYLAVDLDAALGIQRARAALVEDLPWTVILEDISNASVEGLWLQTMDISSDGTSGNTKKSTVQSASVQLIGDAMSNEEIIAFVRTLKQSSHTRDVELTDTRVQKRGQSNGQVGFEITMTVN